MDISNNKNYRYCSDIAPGNELVWDVLIWVLIIILTIIILCQLLSLWAAESIDQLINKPAKIASNTLIEMVNSLERLVTSLQTADKDLVPQLERKKKKILKNLDRVADAIEDKIR